MTTTAEAPGHVRVVARLSLANAITILSGVVTGPIVARALGVDGRGELAAIIAVFTLAPIVLDLGLPSWLARERARGASRGEILGAVLPLVLLGSLVGMLASVPLSMVLGDGRPAVEAFITIGLLISPVVVIPATLIGLAIGDSRWGLVASSRIAASVIPLIGIVLLAVVGRLTVTSAATAYLIGAVLAGFLLLGTLRGVRRLVFSARRTQEALKFGAQNWLIAITIAANHRLDQVLMIPLVSSKELGFYAVAVTISTILTSGLVAAVCHGVFPKVAAGDNQLVARSCRVTLCIVVIVGAGAAIAAPFAVPFVFGAPFADAVPMVTILLVAAVPLAVSVMLGSALTAAGDPAAALRAQLAGLAVMIPALLVFLPGNGGRGAAVISLVAYCVQLVVQLTTAGRRFGYRWRDFLLPTREDYAWVLANAGRGGTPSEPCG